MAQIKRKPKSYQWNLKDHGITQSLLESLFSCPERARLRYQEGFEVIKFSQALKFGDVVHNALDKVYTRFRDTGNPSAAKRILPSVIEEDFRATRRIYLREGLYTGIEQELERLYGMAEVLLVAYLDYYDSDFSGKRTWEALEETFSVPYYLKGFGNIPIRGKVDARYRDKRQRLRIMDTKTKGQIEESSIMKRLMFDLQSMVYTWAIKQVTGEYPAGMLYNVMRRPQLRQTAKEDLAGFLERLRKDIEKRPTHYFMRWETSFTRQDIERWEREFHFMINHAVQWSIGLHQYRVSGSCENKYGTCDFLSYCAHGDASRLRKRVHPFPELVTIKTG